MNKTNIFAAMGVLCLMFLSFGCTSTVLRPYPNIMEPVLTDIGNKSTQKPLEQLSKKVDGVDKILYLQERGRVSSLIGDYDSSIKDFDQAATSIEEKRMQAVISMSNTAAQAGSIVTNDNIIPYGGEGYEKVFIHSYQMLNYLNKKDIDGAMVEARKADNEQTYALQQHEKEITQAQEDAQKNNINREEIEKHFSQPFAEMELAAGKVKNSFQNAFTFYISGVLREMRGDNDAYIDYKKAWEIYPDNKYLAQSLYRLAKKQKRKDLPMLQKKYGTITIPKDTAKMGRLLVIYEDGFVPPKKEIKLPLPIAGVIYTIAMPYYSFQWKDPFQVTVFDNNNEIGRPEPICQVKALAVKALKEKYWGICLRQILRLIAKDQIQRQAEKKGGDLAKYAFGITDAIITNADMRSWLTLPDNVQVADFWLPSGNHSFTHGVNSPADNKFDINIKEGETYFLHIVNTGTGCYSELINPYDKVKQASAGKFSILN